MRIQGTPVGSGTSFGRPPVATRRTRGKATVRTVVETSTQELERPFIDTIVVGDTGFKQNIPHTLGISIPHSSSGTASTHTLGTLTSDVATLGNSPVPPLPHLHHIPPHIAHKALVPFARPHVPFSPVLNPANNPDDPIKHDPPRAKAALSKFCTQLPPLLSAQKLLSVVAEKQTSAPA